jgi:DNA end-binding protein Ku
MATTVWRGFVTFGLISIPVRLFRAARAERVSLRRLHRVARVAVESEEPEEHEERKTMPIAEPEGPARSVLAQDTEEPEFEPIRNAPVTQNTRSLIPEASVTKGFEYERNRFVALDPGELKSIVAKTSSEMELLEFVKLAEVDPVYFETSYYVRPEEAGERAYALLYRALQKTGLVAVGQFAMHGREHVFVLRPGRRGILAHTLYYSSEVRASDEHRAEVETIKPNELQLSEQLIHSLATSFDPDKYKDHYRERLEGLIAAKVEGRPVAGAQPERKPKQVVDITEALKQSLARLKKPPAREAKAAARVARAKKKAGSA